MKPSLNPEIQSEKPHSSSELAKTISEKADQMIATSMRVGRIMLISMIGLIGSNEAMAKPARQTADLVQAVEKGESMKVMSELIKQLAKEKGKNYRWAMKQSDGSVIACNESSSDFFARSNASSRAFETFGGQKGVVVTYMQNKVGSKNVVCVHAEKKKLSPMQAMSHLIQQFGDQYKWAGKQKDGSVIQCAQGSSENKAINEAVKLTQEILSSETRNPNWSTFIMQLSEGTWVAATRGTVAAHKTESNRRTRKIDSGDATAIDLGTLSTRGTGNVKIGGGSRRDVVLPKRREYENSEPESQLDAAAVKAKMRGSHKAIQMCYESELKRDTNLHGKITARIVIGKSGKVNRVYFPKRGKTMRNSAVEACVSRVIHRWRFSRQKQVSDVSIPLIFNASS